MEVLVEQKKKQNQLIVQGNFVEFDHRFVKSFFLNDEWFFSLVDICSIFSDTTDASKFWNKQKSKTQNKGLVYSKFKMKAPDEKFSPTEFGNFKTIMKVLQSISSSKTESVKEWLAKLDTERVEQTIDPSKAVSRALKTWQNQGFSANWISKRV